MKDEFYLIVGVVNRRVVGPFADDVTAKKFGDELARDGTRVLLVQERAVCRPRVEPPK